MYQVLFNIVAYMLAILIDRVKCDGQIAGVAPHLMDGGLSSLQYVDDIILCMKHELDKVSHAKLAFSI